MNLISSLIFALLATYTYAQCVDNSATCVAGTCIDAGCACASGHEGDFCDAADTTGCTWGILENTRTTHIPTYLPAESGFTSGTLKLALSSPIVTDRLHTVVQIGDGIEEGCQYPFDTNQYWAREVVSCEDKFTVDIPWVQALKCGWTKDDTTDAEYTSYVSYLTVIHYDLIDEFRGQQITRDTEHIIPVRIRFQTVVTVSTEITVYAPVNLLTAITQQTYDPETSTGIIEITTSLQHPFILTAETLTGAPPDIIPVLTNEGTSCPDDGSACEQVWRITIDPDVACTLSGNYEIDFVLDCVNPADCPVDLNDNAISILAEINSEDFCTEIVLDIGLTGVMAVYRDDAHNFEKDDFLYDQIAHFKVELSSEAVIIDNQILSVWIEQNGAGTVFFDGAGLSAEGSDANYLAYDGGNDWAAFSFTPNELVTPVPEDSSEAFDVFCRVEVTYQEEEIVKRRRYIMQAESKQSSTTSAHFALAAPSNAVAEEGQNAEAQENGGENGGEQGNSGSNIIVPVAATSGGLLMVAVVAIVAYRKKKSNDEKEPLP